jgi:hypothetical protein
MKTFYFNIQSKGGSGKSMLTYLQALKNENNSSVAFVDLDSSTQTSKRQLKFLTAKKRLFEVDIFDSLRKIEREKMFLIIEALNNNEFTEIYIDFGAPESEQLPGLFSIDFSIDEFKEFETGLGCRFVFNVIVAGGTAYTSSIDYLKRITELIKGKFEVVAYVNEFTFHNYAHLIDEVRAFAKATKGLIKEVKPYGAIHIDRNSGQIITENIREGKGFTAYNSFAAKTIIKRELCKV